MAEAVKVIVRCRPLNDRENKLNCKTIVHIDEERGQCGISKPGAEHPPKLFTFDGAYFMESTTEQIYNDIAYPLVEGVVEGYNGTVFAYGQTGCGKSYSMQGVEEPSTQRGIIPRAFQHIFESIEVAENTKYLVHASYLEIYNEEIRDLLSNDIKQKLELKEHPDRGVYVKELSMHPVSNVLECEKIMSSGWRNRSVGATLMNADSSRSHSIFTIYLEACDTGMDGGDHIRAGKLNLVDLAGSERQSKTGATGERLREATKINLSLSALGNVISALVDGKSKHIPYRDSKLTRLLQDSLGGNTKTLMVACLSPADNNYEETLSTLRYANRAKNIKNKPRINEDPKDALLREYQEEIQKLRSLLAGKLGPEGIKALLEGQSPPPRAKSPQQENGEVAAKEDTVAAENIKNEYEQKLTDLKKQYEAEQMSKAKLQEDMNKLKSQYEQHIADMNKTQADQQPLKQKQQTTKQTPEKSLDSEYDSELTTESEDDEQPLEIIQSVGQEAEMVGTDLVVFRQSANFMLKMSEMIYNHALELSFRKSVDDFPENSDFAQKALTSDVAAGSTPDTGFYESANDQAEPQSVGSGLVMENPQIATYIGSERADVDELTEDGLEGAYDDITETMLVKQHEKALKRLQMLQQTMVGGEKARDEQAKEKLRERKRYSDKRRKQLEEASHNDDEEIILNVYDSIQDEVKARDKIIRRKNQELEAAKMDIEDISYEFERDRTEYLATIRRQEKEIALVQSILEKLQPTIRRDCNYYNLDRIRGEAVWDEDREAWSLPEITIVKTSLPTAGFQRNGGLVSNDTSTTRSFPPQTSPLDSYIRNDVSPEEDKYLSKLRRNTSDDFASNYFKPKRQVQHIISSSSREVPKGYRSGTSPSNGLAHNSNSLSNGDRASPKNYSNGHPQSYHNYNHNSSVNNLPSSTNYNISSPPSSLPRADPMSMSLRPPHRLDAISPRGTNTRHKKKKKSSRELI